MFEEFFDKEHMIVAVHDTSKQLKVDIFIHNRLLTYDTDSVALNEPLK
jgi:hypothetical protein